MHVTVVSPERAVFDGAADAVVAGVRRPGRHPAGPCTVPRVARDRRPRGAAGERVEPLHHRGWLPPGRGGGRGGRRGPDCGRSGRRVLTDRGVALSDVRLLIGTAPVTLPWGGLSYAEADRQCGAGDAWCDVARPRTKRHQHHTADQL